MWFCDEEADQDCFSFRLGNVCRFALAGALGCAVTHGALTPVDVVKTRIQLEPEVYNKVGTAAYSGWYLVD